MEKCGNIEGIFGLKPINEFLKKLRKGRDQMAEEIILSTKLVGDISGDFFVPSYQRGYRWGTDEVTRLLDDVLKSGSTDDGKKDYCLQPVVVRKRGNQFELVDGQQRLTTLYLIYRYLHDETHGIYGEPSFTISYETREKSAQFLQHVNLAQREDNIDFWYMANAYETIQRWFSFQRATRLFSIPAFFEKSVKVIWYEVGPEEDAVALFTRLNIGKIPLTSSELVKAMFLCRDGSKAVSTERQEEISLQWDNMERELHNDSFWFFLTNATGVQYQTRIDLVLDLIAGKPENCRDKYYTFFKFDEKRSQFPMEEIWRTIQKTFLILKDWYEDHEYYHKIGYLIASRAKNLHEIYGMSQGKTKWDFNAALDEAIKNSLVIRGLGGAKLNYADLSYENALDYERLRRLLLLFNVESVRTSAEGTQRFPFDKFKFGRSGEETWSLEHIHAQQSEGLRTQEAWKEWLKLHIPSVQAVSQGKEELIHEMQEAKDSPMLQRETFEALQQRVVELLSVKGNTEYLHSISNLTLLNTGDNAALSNSTFDVKRNKIIEMDKAGQFIPFCTKMVFLKYYTPSENNQLHFWGQADRKAYVEEINKVLREYLEEPIKIEREEA